MIIKMFSSIIIKAIHHYCVSKTGTTLSHVDHDDLMGIRQQFFNLI